MKQVQGKIADHFWNYGWLIPAVLPVAELVGRGVFNSITALYLAWGLFALFPGKFPGDKLLKLSLALTLLFFSFGVFHAHDLPRALKTWFRYGFVSLTLFYTLAAMEKNRSNLKKLCQVLFAVGLIVPVVLVVKTAIVTGGEFLVPRHQLLERNMPFLLPFICRRPLLLSIR